MILAYNIEDVKRVLWLLYQGHQPELASAYYGSSEWLSDATRSNIAFPLFHYDVFNDITYSWDTQKSLPVSISRKSEGYKTYTCYFEVLGNADLDDHEAIDAIEAMTDDLTDRMVIALKNGYITTQQNTRIELMPQDFDVFITGKEMIRRAYGDNDTGFRVNLTVSTKFRCMSGSCEQPWAAEMPNPQLLTAGFTWNILSESLFGVVLNGVNANPALTNPTVYKVWYHNEQSGGQPTIYDEDDLPDIKVPLKASRYIRIEQTLTDADGNTSIAVAILLVAGDGICTPFTLYPPCGKAHPNQ